MNIEDIHQLLKDLGWCDDDCIVITRARRPETVTDSSMVWLSADESLSARQSRAEVAVVFDLFDAEDKDASRHLLARLRDQYAERVVIRDDGHVFNATELLALGYIKAQRPQLSGRFFVHDPDIYYQRREWNNSVNWANPENFEKYRW